MKRYGIVTDIKTNRRFLVADELLVNNEWVNADPEADFKKGDVVELFCYDNGVKSAQLVPDYIWYPLSKGICYQTFDQIVLSMTINCFLFFIQNTIIMYEKQTLVIAIDCERNGLRGQFLSIGIVTNLQTSFEWAIETEGMALDHWVEENVLPHLAPSTHKTEKEMLQDFAEWWLDQNSKYNVVLIGHMMSPVETDLFSQMYQLGFIGTFDGPYQMHDLSTILMYNGFKHDKLDAFLEDSGYTFSGKTHSALGDAERVMTAWKHFNCDSIM